MKSTTLLRSTRDALMGRGFSCMEVGKGEAGPGAFEVIEGGETFVVRVTGGPEISDGQTVRTPENVEGETAEVLGIHRVEEGEKFAALKTDEGEKVMVPLKELVVHDGGAGG